VYSSRGLSDFSSHSSFSTLGSALDGGDVVFKLLNQFRRSVFWEGCSSLCNGKVSAFLDRKRESQLVVSVEELVLLELLERVGDGGVVEERLNMPIVTIQSSNPSVVENGLRNSELCEIIVFGFKCGLLGCLRPQPWFVVRRNLGTT
jgi:hypothetical protein